MKLNRHKTKTYLTETQIDFMFSDFENGMRGIACAEKYNIAYSNFCKKKGERYNHLNGDKIITRTKTQTELLREENQKLRTLLVDQMLKG